MDKTTVSSHATSAALHALFLLLAFMAPVTLVLEDRLPVSEDERIDVEIGKETTPGYKDSERRPGVKIWTLEFEPGEKREVVLSYSVRYPKEMQLPEIE